MKVTLDITRFQAMGSRCELKLYASPAQAANVARAATALVQRLENKYSRYRADSCLSTINASAGAAQPLKVDDETAALLNYAQALYEQSDGLFDISSGILRRAWNFKSNQLPTPAALAELLPLIGWNKISWQPPYIHLPLAGMELDLGGYVKEYTVDLVANLCNELGVTRGVVNLGGDVRVLGPHPNGEPWQIGIQHPRRAKEAIAYVDIHEGAIATSGDYERFMMIDGQRYSHLLNPHTGLSIAPAFASVSVIAPQCLVAGSFSTIALLKSAQEPEWIQQAGLSYLSCSPTLELRGTILTAPQQS